MSRSLAIAPSGDRFLLGTEWCLRLFDGKGREIWNVAAPSVAWGVNISGDGRFALGAFGDGTIRWYDLRDGRELLAFFPHKDGKRWVAWTPEGFFAASEGGGAALGLSPQPRRRADARVRLRRSAVYGLLPPRRAACPPAGRRKQNAAGACRHRRHRAGARRRPAAGLVALAGTGAGEDRPPHVRP